MAKFRKKPVVINAEQFDPDATNWPEGVVVDTRSPTGYSIGALENTAQGHEVTPGDWIITGVKGEKYPCKDDVFRQTYERVDEPRPFSVSRMVTEEPDLATADQLLRQNAFSDPYPTYVGPDEVTVDAVQPPEPPSPSSAGWSGSVAVPAEPSSAACQTTWDQPAASNTDVCVTDSISFDSIDTSGGSYGGDSN